MRLLYLLVALVAGAATSLQVPVNATLRTHLAHPLQATLVSFTVGTLLSLICCLVLGSPPPTGAVLSRIPWWAWCGGIFGTLYVGSSVVLSPKIGVAAMLSMVIAGQMLMSLVIDHYGLARAPIYALTPQRIVGAVLVALGAAVMAYGK